MVSYNPDTMMNAKSNPVFDIPELLESILLDLDMVTLLTSAQRVCKHWRETIQNSYNIQGHLFFKPHAHRKMEEQERVLNPLLKPKIMAECLRTYTSGLEGRDLHRRMAYLEPGASWRRMLFHQPPILGNEGEEPKRLGMLGHLMQVPKGRV